MNVTRIHILFFLATILLVACSGAPVETAQSPAQAPAVEAAQAAVKDISPSPRLSESSGEQAQQTWPDGQAQEDKQGQVGVAVTPLNLNNHGTTLEFDIAMDTHSVDLSMDLAQLATLSTDTGHSVGAIVWNAPSGGHHVAGLLNFPASIESGGLLDGASQLTLAIQNVDAPERTFIWHLSQ